MISSELEIFQVYVFVGFVPILRLSMTAIRLSPSQILIARIVACAPTPNLRCAATAWTLFEPITICVGTGK